MKRILIAIILPALLVSVGGAQISGRVAHRGYGPALQLYDPNLTAFAGLAGTADTVPYFTGPGAMDVVTWGSGLAFSAGTAAFAPTELEALTWGPGTSASWAWTFDVTGATNPTMTVSATGMAFSHNVAGATYGSDASITDAELLTWDNGATTEIPVGGGAGSAPVWTTATGTGAPVRADSPTFTDDIQLAADGVLLSGADGDLTILGKGNGFDEDLTIDLDTTENTGTITSSTGLATMNFSGIALQESGNAVPNATDHLGFFAATTSAQLYGVLSDETGSASGSPVAVFSVSPTLTGTPLVGTTAAGGNLTVNATEGANIVTNGTFTTDLTGWAGANWAYSVDTALHTAGATTALSQAAATVVSGTTYKLTFDVVGGTTGTVTPSFGGFTGAARNFGSASYTQYGTASATTALAFTPTTTFNGALDNVVLVALTDATGDLNVYGNLRAYSPIQDPAGTNTITLLNGNVGIRTNSPSTALEVRGTYSSPRGQIYLNADSGQKGYLTLNAEANQEVGIAITAAGTAKWFIYRPSSSNDLIFYDTTNRLILQSGGNVGLGTTVPVTKLDQAQFSADALGSGHTFSKSRHATAGSHTIVNDNDVIGFTNYAPSDGTDFGTIAARIHGETDDDAPAASSIGGALVFSTAAGLAADDLTERVRIDRTGMMIVKSFASTGIVTKVAGDSPYTPAKTDFMIRYDVTAGNSIVAPEDATGSGRIIVIKKTDSGANTLSISPAGGSTIDGAATQVLAVKSSITIMDVAADTYELID